MAVLGWWWGVGYGQRERTAAATDGWRYVMKLTLAGFMNADDEQNEISLLFRFKRE